MPAFVAAALLGTLLFLFVRTQSVHFKADAHALGLLREMKDIDTRWDMDALRARQALQPLSPGSPPAPDRAARLERLLRDLEATSQDRGVSAHLPALRAMLAEKAAASRAQDAWQRFSYVTLGARLDLAAAGLSKSMEAALDEQDRWRAYLAAYAAALLVGVGYLAARVVAAQRALRLANGELERRVAERTADLTRALSQLKDSEAQLVQTEKMSSLGQLVAGVAHEINTPLAYVKNGVASVRERMPELRETLAQSRRLLAMLQSGTAEPGELQAAFAALSARLDLLAEHQVLEDLDALTRDGLHGIEQIAELVGNLRNFARLDRSKVASYNVNESVRSTLLIARPLLRRIDVEQRLGEIPSITCSPSQVNQVLLNLVTNSAQAMIRARGRITVATRREGPHHVAIEVADNGRGIPPEALPRIFDPFFTTKAVGQGTGLGLSIAYKIVAQHGGRIDVRSEPGAGATFTVVLPVTPPAEREPEPARAEEAIA
jgi:signal transduction histidine kinase